MTKIFGIFAYALRSTIGDMSKTTGLTVEPDSSYDRRHRAKDDPYARESIVYMAHVPEISTSVVAYTWVNGRGEAGTAASVFRRGRPTVNDGVADSPIDDDADFEDWNVGPLHLRHLETNKAAHLVWHGKKFDFTMDFSGIHPPYPYSHGARGCPVYVADDRIEQAGRIGLQLSIDGQTSTYECTGHRDHSWGARDWQMMQHYKWVEAQTANSAVQVFEINAGGARTVYGYVFRDEEMATITDARFDPTFDEQMFVVTVELKILDEMGRTTVVRAVAQAHAELHVSPSATLADSASDTWIDGVAGGGYVDFSWPPDYLAHMRQRRSSIS